MLGEYCPTANSEPSTSNTHGSCGSGCFKMGAVVKQLFRRSNASCSWVDQWYSCSFLLSCVNDDSWEVPDEFSVKICEPYKALHSFFIPGSWPLLDCLNLLGVHTDPFQENHQTEKMDFLHNELTFPSIHKKAVKPETQKYLVHMNVMELQSCWENQNVVQVNYDK